MAGLKEVRERITSISSTKQITSAMKMVSAAKLRRAQDAITRMRPYASKLQEILANLSASLDSSEGGAYSIERPIEKVLIVAVSSNRGLCGGFNSNVNKKVLSLANGAYAGKQIDVLSIGKKSGEFLKRRNFNVIERNDSVYDNLTFDVISPIAQKIMDTFVEGKYDRVDVVYNQFKNAATQLCVAEQFLPVAPPEVTEKTSSTDYIFEPAKAEIVADLIPRSLKTQLYAATLDSHASEHGARMTAMHKATDNASDILKALKLSYNKARQAAITNEILEIVGGAAALEEG
ncbi:MAG: ATP synthase F1 subunit gamma [Flavobacteriales bacterium]|nr:ATP synthase F1 subunit gamma [Flavobacteriales bacterium]